MTDWYLIRRFREDRSEAAFGQLVSRYIKLVYSVCYAELQNAQAAEDATQAVFLVLARKAEFHRGSTLSSWLFRTAKYVARHARDAEASRQRMQNELEIMHREQTNVGDPSDSVALILTEALSALREPDREALLLRYYQDMSLAEVGDALGVSEDAARKRIARGLDKVRAYLGRHGVANALGVLTAGMAITVPLEARSEAMVYAISQGLTPAVGLAASTAANQLTLEVLKKMAMMKLKWTVAAAIVIAGAGSGTAYVMGQGIGGGAGPGGSAPNAAQNRSLPMPTGKIETPRPPHVTLAQADAAIRFLTQQHQIYLQKSKLVKKNLDAYVRHAQSGHRQTQSLDVMAKHDHVLNGYARDYLLLKKQAADLEGELVSLKQDRAKIVADDNKAHGLSRMSASSPSNPAAKNGLTDREVQQLKAKLSSLNKPLTENELNLLNLQLASVVRQYGVKKKALTKAEQQLILNRSQYSLLPPSNTPKKRRVAKSVAAWTKKYSQTKSEFEAIASQQQRLEMQIAAVKARLAAAQKA
ncbi:MAG: sigma-70 family RNA polymerase sigma factor [Capsulimonas sp.]|uniref:RNA polymerase sigma factor n=1 Tax=Capsulimonas sp. TaxID=2494211 RepID=UPI0032679E10